MAVRGTLLSDKIQRIIGINDERVPKTLIFDSINDTQKQIAQRLLCLEGSGNITTDANGAASLPSGFFRLKRLVLSDNNQIFPKEVDVENYDILQHLLFSNISTTIQYYKIWDGSITLFPNPGINTYTMFFYALPTTTISASVDPEVPDYMDDCLRFGALSDLWNYKEGEEAILLAQYWKRLFDEEMDRLEQMWRKTKTVFNTIQYHDV